MQKFIFGIVFTRAVGGCGGGGRGGGLLQKYNGYVGELQRVWNPEPVKDKKILKYVPCLDNTLNIVLPFLGQRWKYTPSLFESHLLAVPIEQITL